MQPVTGFRSDGAKMGPRALPCGSIRGRPATYAHMGPGPTSPLRRGQDLVRRLWDTVIARFGDDNAEWGLSSRTATLIFLAPFVLALVAVITVPFRDAFRILANEDGIAEWGQWLFLVMLVVIYARLSVALWRQRQRPLAVLYAVATLAVIFTAGEEISWGQRIFHWITPGALEDINNQGETNIHNIGSLLKIFNIVIMAVAFIAALLPLVRWTLWRDRARSIAGYALIPPAVLIPAFGMEFSYRLIRYLLFPEPRYVLTKLSEIAELSFYFALVVFGVLAWRVIVSGWRPPSPTTAAMPASVDVPTPAPDPPADPAA